jgi:hypothetical protein
MKPVKLNPTSHPMPKMTRAKSKISPPGTLSHSRLIYDNQSKEAELAKFVNQSQKTIEVEMSRSEFAKFSSCHRILLNAGYPFSTDIEECKQLHEQWCNSSPKGRTIIVPKPGWTHGIYLYSNQAKTINGVQYLFRNPNDRPQHLVKGTEDQLRQLVRLASYSPALMLGMGLRFSATLLPATNLGNISFYCCSPNALDRLAFTGVVGTLSGGSCDLRLGNKPLSEVERLAVAHNHSLLSRL